MSKRKAQAVRGIRKSAHLSRKVFSKAANFSGRVEQKADRIIHGTDPTIQIHDKVLFEKIYAEALPEIVPLHPALPRPGRPAAVSLFIPSLQKSSFFGGTATALIFAGMLAAKKKMPIRIVETLVHGNAKEKELSSFFTSNGLSIPDTDIELVNVAGRKYNHYGYIDLHPEDIFIASAWWDAYLLDKLPLLRPYIYLIQDYEPIFYNNSDRYVLAESTYHSSKSIPVCNTELMYKFMASEGYAHIRDNGMWFEPGVGLNIESVKASTKDKKRMFIYGRPSVERNLFYFALSCLDDMFLSQQLVDSQWEIYMAGQDNIADIVLGSGVTIKNLGKMQIQDYHDFVRTVDVAISPMMAPHPNYPTLEFASAGAAVVTTKYKTKQDLTAYSPNIYTTDITKEAFIKSIEKACGLDREERIAKLRYNKILSDWGVALGDTVSVVCKKI